MKTYASQLYKENDVVKVNMMSGTRQVGKIRNIKTKNNYIYYDIYMVDLDVIVKDIPQYMVCWAE